MAVNPTSNASGGFALNANTGVGINAGAGMLDASGLQRLRDAAHENSPEALKKAATQFEALFLDMVMKSMREAAPAEGLMDSEQGKMMQGMLDQQYSKALATRGIGLADVLVRQMSPKGVPVPGAGPVSAGNIPAATRSASDSVLSALIEQGGVSGQLSGASVSAATTARPALPADTASATTTTTTTTTAAAADTAHKTSVTSVKRGFIDKLLSHAETVSAATGIPSRFMVAHAALESGCGRREIRNPDGSNSHNVFGIKAGASWKGKFTEVATTEYVNGVPQKRIERFRSYDSYADAFADYAKTLTGSSRYRDVVASASDATGFAHGLQKAGYATDPRYAEKLSRVIARV